MRINRYNQDSVNLGASSRPIDLRGYDFLYFDLFGSKVNILDLQSSWEQYTEKNSITNLNKIKRFEEYILLFTKEIESFKNKKEYNDFPDFYNKIIQLLDQFIIYLESEKKTLQMKYKVINDVPEGFEIYETKIDYNIIQKSIINTYTDKNNIKYISFLNSSKADVLFLFIFIIKMEIFTEANKTNKSNTKLIVNKTTLRSFFLDHILINNEKINKDTYNETFNRKEKYFNSLNPTEVINPFDKSKKETKNNLKSVNQIYYSYPKFLEKSNTLEASKNKKYYFEDKHSKYLTSNNLKEICSVLNELYNFI